MEVNTLFISFPTVPAEAMITTDINPAMIEYSIADAPSSLRKNSRTLLRRIVSLNMIGTSSVAMQAGRLYVVLARGSVEIARGNPQTHLGIIYKVLITTISTNKIKA